MQKDLEAGKIDEEKARKRAEAYQRRIDAAEKAMAGHIEMPASEPAKTWFGGTRQGFVVVPEDTPKSLKKQVAMYADAQVQERRLELDAAQAQAQDRQDRLDERERAIAERERGADAQAAELKKLRDERLAASLAFAKLLKIENASMNREKVFRAVISSSGDGEKLKGELSKMRIQGLKR